MTSVFAKYESKSYPFRFAGTLLVRTIAGGTPTDPKVAAGWLKTKLADKDDLIREAVAEVMTERGVTAEEAVEHVDLLKHLNGFKRDPEQGLYIEGRQLKAAIKEAACVARSVGKLPDRWGLTRKGIESFVAEHVFVVEDRLYLGVTEPTGIAQRFVHTFRGSGIQYEEYVEDAKVDFTVEADYDFKGEEWAQLWLTGERQGIGASRSQGFGRYEVVRWEKLS
jgi:hypothetical protein